MTVIFGSLPGELPPARRKRRSDCPVGGIVFSGGLSIGCHDHNGLSGTVVSVGNYSDRNSEAADQTASDSALLNAATKPTRPNAGRDFDPVFFMMAARWFSTVRWLICKSAAMFLLGDPRNTRSMISCCRGVWFESDCRTFCCCAISPTRRSYSRNKVLADSRVDCRRATGQPTVVNSHVRCVALAQSEIAVFTLSDLSDCLGLPISCGSPLTVWKGTAPACPGFNSPEQHLSNSTFGALHRCHDAPNRRLMQRFVCHFEQLPRRHA
jgi:hypothetical protein